MKTKANLFILLFLFMTFMCIESKKISKGRGSGSSRGTSRRTGSQPVPTSHSNPHSAQKPTLFGWQESTAQRSKPSTSKQSRPSQTHSYPSSQTGLSGNPQNNGKNTQQVGTSGQQSNVNQNNHGYPASSGMSGQSGAGNGYPSQQGGGLSGNAPKQQYPQNSAQPSNQQNHAYPSNNAQPSNQQSHAYPSNTGLSGNSGQYPHHGPPPPYSGGNHPANGGAYGANNYGNNNNYRHQQGPPPPYPGNMAPSYGGYGSHPSGYGSNMPGYFGNYGNNGKGFGGMSRTRSALTGVGIAGAGVGTLLTGLALWNLARSTGNRHHTVIYDRGQPVAVASADNSSNPMDSILGDLVNCTLTISSINTTEVLAIPCAIATSFTPDADVKDKTDVNNNDKEATKCIVTVVNKASKEFTTTIPCSILLNSAAENNVTEAPMTLNGTNDLEFKNDTMGPIPGTAVITEQPLNLESTILANCSLVESGDVRDPINPCFTLTHDVTVLPLSKVNDTLTTPLISY